MPHPADTSGDPPSGPRSEAPRRTGPDGAGRLEAALTARERRLRVLETELATALERLAKIEPVVASRRGRALLRAGNAADLLVAGLAPPESPHGRQLRRAKRLASVLARDGVGAALRQVRERRERLDPTKASPPTCGDQEYRRWLAHHEPTPVELEEMRRANAEWAFRPLISVVVPVFNPAREWLGAMIESVVAQAYDNWELCLADDLSTAPHVRPTLTYWASRDRRVKVVFRTANGNIAAASNTALSLALGEFVALVDHDDVLRPQALHRVVEVLRDERETDVVYSDEDKILVGGQRGQVHFKGDFDPDYLLSTNYMCHLSVLRRDLVNEVGGFRSGVDGSQDHDILLRVSERARAIRHVADVLYSWKQVPGSAALSFAEKPAAWTAGRHAVQAALARRTAGARAEFGPYPGLYVARYPLPSQTRATVVVLAEDAATTARSLRRLRRTPAAVRTRWVVAGADPRLGGLSDPDVSVRLTTGSANQGRLINEIVADSDGDVVIVLGGDLAPLTAGVDWLHPLVEQAMRNEVGAVGCRILRRDGSPEQEGLHVGGHAVVGNIGVRWPVIQRVAAVSADCLAFRRDCFDALGGFDDRYRLSLFDVDFCLRLRRAGLATVYTPLTELQRLRHRADRPPADDDARELCDRWKDSDEWRNPYVSPWLDRVSPMAIRTS